jgi:D-2-hydroxyglutarate dehydrogenase
MIGGNLATNAGGINFIKHNSMHANCIGLKAVLPNGDILDNMTTLRKDNTGYDLKQLFIGAEGTLGIITECAILCAPLAKHKNMVLLSCKSFEDVLVILNRAKAELSDILRAVEFMDWDSVDCVVRQFKHLKYPFH